MGNKTIRNKPNETRSCESGNNLNKTPLLIVTPRQYCYMRSINISYRYFTSMTKCLIKFFFVKTPAPGA